MTFSASDVTINPNVRCDSSGAILAGNLQKIKDLLKQVGDQLNGDTLEDIINNQVGGGDTHGIFIADGIGGDTLLADLPKDYQFSSGASSNTSRWQIESDNITITDLTGGGPFVMILTSAMSVTTPVASVSYGKAIFQVYKRTNSLAAYNAYNNVLNICSWGTDASGSPPDPWAAGSAVMPVISGIAAGNQYKARLIINGTSGAAITSVSISDFAISFIEL